ncbi:MAG: winged helix-turn-helix transcriptional regulator [Vampirovibrionales bacterium]|nr:winged helix-turn-helix transcriptional regulator [Vampirovibrionales bacterium]
MSETPLKIEQAVGCLKTLAHPVRLSILCALREGERSVQTLEASLSVSQSLMSTHLAKMRDREIVIARREGHQVFYRVRDPRLFALLDLLQTLYCPPL